MSKVTFNCRVCGFRLVRANEDLQKDCPKCFQARPYVNESDKAAAATKAAALAPSSAMEATGGNCPKSANGHQYKFGKCSLCGAAEGKLAKGSGNFANPGGVSDCVQGKKHMYMFAKCKHCGKSELAK